MLLIRLLKSKRRAKFSQPVSKLPAVSAPNIQRMEQAKPRPAFEYSAPSRPRVVGLSGRGRAAVAVGVAASYGRSGELRLRNTQSDLAYSPTGYPVSIRTIDSTDRFGLPNRIEPVPAYNPRPGGAVDTAMRQVAAQRHAETGQFEYHGACVERPDDLQRVRTHRSGGSRKPGRFIPWC